jgi:PBSX family phage terminase large subunit
MPTIKLFPKQEHFYFKDNRINVYVGGIQSGKTTGGGLKMYSLGLLKHRSPDDNFIIAADTYKTLSQATIPKFLTFAKGLGSLNRQSGEFKTHWGSTIYLRTATEPESMEGITNVRRIWVDEAGKTSRYFFENVMGRAAFKEAPIDLTTTPYAMNWLAALCEEATEGKREDVNFVNCRSIDSPYFPKAEYERQKKLLDPRRFAMKYDGVFGKMEGLVYDLYEECLIQSFPLPPGTKFYAGVDWGYFPDPFALVLRAVTPEGRHYRIGEYFKNYLTIDDIVKTVGSYHGIYHFERVICDPSQPAHIEELNRKGIPASPADNDIRFGIDLHYSLMKQGRFFIFKDMCPTGVDEYSTYHYPEQKELSVDQSLKDSARVPVSQNDHGLDADRYLSRELLRLDGPKIIPKVPRVPGTGPMPMDLMERSKWLRARRPN